MTTWTSADGKHQGTVELRDFGGRRIKLEHEYDDWVRTAEACGFKVFDGRDGVATNTFALLVTCTCGWRQRWPDRPEFTDDLHEVRLTADGGIDVDASEASARQEWKNHVERPEVDFARQLRSLDPLVRLVAIKNLRGLLDGQAAVAAADARQDDRSWETIGRCLGISKQAARARYVDGEPKRFSTTT